MKQFIITSIEIHKNKSFYSWIRPTSNNFGFISLSGVLFYTMSFLIVLAIPITVILVKSEKQQLTQASRGFKNPPTINIAVEPTEIKLSEKIKIIPQVSESNWYSVYYITGDHLLDAESTTIINNSLKNRFTAAENFTLIHEGVQTEDFDFAPLKTGFVVAVAFQLKNYLSNFKTSDVLCAWNKRLYIYKEDVNLINEVLGNNDEIKQGAWQPLLNCTNSGPVKIIVNQ